MIWQAISAVVLALLVGELLKFLLRNKGRYRLFAVGGGVSNHSATTSALCTAVLYETGFGLLFLVCVVFAIVIVRDAFSARWEISCHSEALNKLTRSKQYLRVGHTFKEVLYGIFLGVVVAVLVYTLW